MSIRAPHVIREILLAGARARRLSISGYLASLLRHAEDEIVTERLSKTAQSFVPMRPEDAGALRDLARQFDRRQWEVLLELHRRAGGEDEAV